MAAKVGQTPCPGVKVRENETADQRNRDDDPESVHGRSVPRDVWPGLESACFARSRRAAASRSLRCNVATGATVAHLPEPLSPIYRSRVLDV